MATVVRDGLRLQASIFPAGELVRGGRVGGCMQSALCEGDASSRSGANAESRRRVSTCTCDSPRDYSREDWDRL